MLGTPYFLISFSKKQIFLLWPSVDICNIWDKWFSWNSHFLRYLKPDFDIIIHVLSINSWMNQWILPFCLHLSCIQAGGGGGLVTALSQLSWGKGGMTSINTETNNHSRKHTYRKELQGGLWTVWSTRGFPERTDTARTCKLDTEILPAQES